MKRSVSFDDRVKTRFETMTPAEQRVSRFFQDHREVVLYASASVLAKKSGTSDATVIRTAKALGFSGLEDLRRTLATEMRQNLSPAGRLVNTLREVGDDLHTAFNMTLDIQQKALEGLRRDVTPEQFRTAVQLIGSARRVFIFGIGPSSAIATYAEVQLGRFGVEAIGLTQTGLLLADGLRKLREGDLLIVFAYSRVYRELATLLEQANHCGVAKILITDTLGGTLRRRVDLVLSVARGRAEMLSTHTATLSLIETLLVGLATTQPEKTLSSLRALNQLRAKLVGKSMELPEY